MRRLDLFSLLLFAGLALAALLARRNVPLFVLGSLPLVADCLADLGARSGARRLRARWRAAAALGLALGSAGLAWAVATNHYYRLDDKSHETGRGVLDYRFPIRAASFFERTGLPGPHYNDLSSGGYLVWAAPTSQGVFIDGRLEVYDDFFAAYLEGLRDATVWSRQAERFGIQSAILFHAYRNRHPLIRRLQVSQAWKLVYVDEVVVVFVRVRGNEAAIAHALAAFGPELTEIERRLLDRPRHRGYPLAHVRAVAAFARALDVVGQRDRAVPWFERSLEFDLDRRERYLYALWLGNYHYLRGDAARARPYLLQAAAADPHGAQARWLLERLDDPGP